MAKPVCYLNQGFDRLCGPQIAGKNETKTVFELRKQRCRNPGVFEDWRSVLIRVWVIHDLAGISIASNRFQECPRLNE
ncbi:hypothetical protein D3C86_1184440 [compost metagenome]